MSDPMTADDIRAVAAKLSTCSVLGGGVVRMSARQMRSFAVALDTIADLKAADDRISVRLADVRVREQRADSVVRWWRLLGWCGIAALELYGLLGSIALDLAAWGWP